MKVVYDEHLLVAATAFAGQTWTSWPDVPPYTRHPEQDCLGIIATSPRHDHDVSLLVSHRLLARVARALRAEVGLADRDIDDYLKSVLQMARESQGGVVTDPTSIATRYPEHVEVPLSLLREHAPDGLLVGSSKDVASIAYEEGAAVPALAGGDFARRVDWLRRQRRRR